MTGLGAARSAYLVERYLASTDGAELAAAAGRLILACEASTGTAMAVRYLSSTLVPADDTCFCLFEAASSDAVRAVNVVAGFDFDRISVAEIITPAS